MELSKKDKTIKYTLYCVILAAAALLQNVHGLWFQIGSARCFFLVPVVLFLSLGEDERTAAFLGLFAGFLWDCVSAAHMGFNCIVLMVLCYIAAAVVNFLLRNTYWVAVVSAVICTFVYCILYWLFIVTHTHTHSIHTNKYLANGQRPQITQRNAIGNEPLFS